MLFLAISIGVAVVFFLLVVGTMAYSALTSYQAVVNSVQVQGPANSSGIGLSAPSGGATITLRSTYALGAGAGQVQFVIQNTQSVSASSSVTLDLTSIVDVLGNTVTTIAKVKAYEFALLNATQDSVNGTQCSSITIGGGSSNPCLLNLAGTTPTLTINNGGQQAYADATAAGITVVSSTVKTVKITNNDATFAADVYVSFLAA